MFTTADLCKGDIVDNHLQVLSLNLGVNPETSTVQRKRCSDATMYVHVYSNKQQAKMDCIQHQTQSAVSHMDIIVAEQIDAQC